RRPAAAMSVTSASGCAAAAASAASARTARPQQREAAMNSHSARDERTRLRRRVRERAIEANTARERSRSAARERKHPAAEAAANSIVSSDGEDERAARESPAISARCGDGDGASSSGVDDDGRAMAARSSVRRAG
ncbi:hypothetical protein Dimus_036949, partial [Dionaea muscipula]